MANEEEAHEGYTLKLDDYFPPFAADRWQKKPPALQFVASCR
jgi:hypothetical protein